MEKEFLPDYFSSAEAALGAVFRKGYEWPFSIGRVSASSRWMLRSTMRPCVRAGRVFLDYRTDPAGLNGPFSQLEKEAYDCPCPILRRWFPAHGSACSNEPAGGGAYRAHGIDLSPDPL